MVEIEGQKRPQIACDTPIKEGMVVRTKGEKIDAVHRNILELELINHPVDCPVCDQAGECKLQDFYMDYGLYESKIDPGEKVKHDKHIDLGSNVMLDQERCVLCARCTRFTADITQTHELGIIGRGDHARVSTMPGRKLENPYAMNVVDLCPVGALTSKDFRFKQRVWFLKEVPSVCHGCDTGCNIFIDHNRPKYEDDQIYRFRPRRNDAVNGHFICDEGRLSYKELQENRLTQIRQRGEAIEENQALAALQALLTEHKGKILLLANANLYTEELEALIDWAEHIGAELSIPMGSYYDEAFGDDWLKSPQRAANAKAVEKLRIATTLPETKPTLLISFNHPDTETIAAEKTVLFATHDTETPHELLLPLAVYSESQGTLINRNGIEQHSPKAIVRNEPVPDVLRWIDMIPLGGAQ
jgi:NADH-quinone oxidoreductase subunit G